MEMEKKLLTGLMLVSVLFFVTLSVAKVYADYVGPATRTTTTGSCDEIIRNYDDAYICSFPKGGSNYDHCGDHCGSPSNVDCLEAYCDAIRNGSPYYRVEDQPGTVITLPNATASGSVTCSVPGTNGWCRGGHLTFEGHEPVDGYVITGIETDLWGHTCNTNAADVTCNYNPGDGTGTVTYWAESSWGDSSAQHTLSWKIDTTAPTLTVGVPTPDGQNGWFVTTPTVTANASDATAGVASIQYQIDNGTWANETSATVSGDGIHTVTFKATDNAGNTTTKTATVKVDTTAPNLSPAVSSGTQGANGWYISAVTVSANAGDAASGVARVEHKVDGGEWQDGATVTVSSDGVHTVKFKAVDNAGNTTTKTLTVKVDTTAPSLTVNIPPPDGQNGWFITNPQVKANGSDIASGIDVVQCRVDGGGWQAPPITVGGDGTHTVECQAVDNAGNTAAWSDTVKIDTTAPTATVSVSGTMGFNNWYVTAPTIDANASDAVSGVAAVQYRLDGGAWQDGDNVILGDGVHTIQFRVTDNAGNTFTTSGQAVKVDTTAPSLNPSIPSPDGQNGWFVTYPQVDASGSDTVSGLAWVACRVDGGEWQTPPVSVTGDGTHTVDCQAVDNAGNTAAWSDTVKVDTTVPVLTPSEPAPDGQNGWYVTEPQIDASGSDATSGLALLQCRVDGGEWQTPPVSVTGDGTHTVDCQAVDNAGNTATWSDTVKVDTTAPTANPATSGTMGDNGWYISTVTVQANASDAASGVARVEHKVDGGEWQDGDSVTLGDGVHTVAFRVTDNAGNVTTTPAQTVKVDATAPVLTPSAPTPDGQNGWFVTEPQVDARGSDATSGLASVQCRVDGGKWQSPPVLVIGDGVHALDCQAQDNAGNTAAWSGTVKVDTTAPVSAFETPAEGATVWGIVTLHGVSDDPTSGLANVEVSTDNGATWKPATLVASTSQWTAFWDTRPLPDGTYTLMARAQDEAGNEEHTAIVHVTVANAPPQVSLHPGRWYSWQTAQANITPNPYIPLKSVTVSVLGPAGYVRRWHYGAVQHVDIHWNARWYSENGEWAHPGKYRVVVEAVDIYGHSGSAKGVVIVPQPAPTATPTPTATLTPTSTATATATPTPTATAPLPTATPTQPPAVSQPTAAPTIALPSSQVKSGKNSLAKAVPMGVVGVILALLAGALIADPRPKPTRELANTLNQINRYLEHKRRSSHA